MLADPRQSIWLVTISPPGHPIPKYEFQSDPSTERKTTALVIKDMQQGKRKDPANNKQNKQKRYEAQNRPLSGCHYSTQFFAMSTIMLVTRLVQASHVCQGHLWWAQPWRWQGESSMVDRRGRHVMNSRPNWDVKSAMIIWALVKAPSRYGGYCRHVRYGATRCSL